MLTAAVLVGDSVTKLFMKVYLIDVGHKVPVTSFFDLTLGYNRGISFGLFSSESDFAPYVLATIALLVAFGLTVWLWRNQSLVQKFGLSATVGGAIGNAIDRLQDGAVTDFLDFYVGAYHWPAFNLADIAIACGVGALLIGSLCERPRTQTSNG
tara:strand:- start:1211 stop:1672 length:462 start_codon:yes stop_codon:yes gene_type:complete